eukprot:m.28804 g.28804  ORF g.28804 m.28804 type:complete len:421 (+) comp10478_c0_seq1:1119-2381(+)
MRHFVAHVLTEAKLVRICTNLHEELVDTANVITQRLIGNHALGHSLTNGHFGQRLTMFLVGGGVQRQHSVTKSLELGVILVVGIKEIFNLGKWEFTHTQETRARRNFVTVCNTNLCTTKRQLVTVEIVQALESHKNALSKLRAKKTGVVTSRANLGLEHHVEVNGVRKIIASNGRFDLKLLEQSLQLLFRVCVSESLDMLKLLHLGNGSFRILHLSSHHILEKVISTVAIASLHITHHDISKALGVTRGVKNTEGRHGRAVDFKDVVFKNEMTTPFLLNAIHDGTTGWSIVIETGDTAIDFKCRSVEEAALHKIFKAFTFERLVFGLLSLFAELGFPKVELCNSGSDFLNSCTALLEIADAASLLIDERFKLLSCCHCRPCDSQQGRTHTRDKRKRGGSSKRKGRGRQRATHARPQTMKR